MGWGLMLTPACTGKTNGVTCTREAVISDPVALCNTHRLEVALGVLPGVLIDAMQAHEKEFTAPDAMPVVAERISFDTLPTGTHEPVVYFISNGGRVKIGYTTNIYARLSALTLRSDNVLMVFRGGPDLERALHGKFADHRVGNTEWFEAAREILSFASTGEDGTRDTKSSPSITELERPTDRSLDPADQVAILVDRLREGEKVTKRSAAALLGTSDTTAQRRLTAAKAAMEKGTGQYL